MPIVSPRGRVMHTRPRYADRPVSRQRLLCLAAFTSSWTAAAIAGTNLVDYLLALAVAVAVFSWLFGNRSIFVRWWMVLPTFAALLVTAIDVTVGGGENPGATPLLRYALTTLLIPVLLLRAAHTSGAGVMVTVLKWWAAGAAVNAAAAVGVSLGLLSFQGILVQPTGERLGGLSSHPNSLAFTLSLALPVLVYLVATQREKVLWIALLAVSAWGMFVTDSRSGFLVGYSALAVAVAVALARSRLRYFALPAGLLAAIIVWLQLPSLFGGTRVAQGSEQSNVGRIRYNSDAINTFLANPFFGGGLDDQTGVAVVLLLISGGGLVLFVSYAIFFLAPLGTLLAHRHLWLGSFGLIFMATVAAFGVLNPVVLERAAFWPVLIAMFVLQLKDDSSLDARTHGIGRSKLANGDSVDLPDQVHGAARFPARRV